MSHAWPLLIVNDYLDLVEVIGADGLHMGQSDGSVFEARKRLSPNKILGVSAGTVEEAVQAEVDGADYIGCGHIYPTVTKEKRTPPLGPDGLRRVVEAVGIPVVAIGGITVERVGELDCAGVVVCSAVQERPRAACQLFVSALQRDMRQIALPEVGRAGQRRLSRASVLVVGCGGLGCPALQYLVGAGVGRVGLIDGDRIEASNLPRQPLYTPFDIGQLKAEVAAERLRQQNPGVAIDRYSDHLSAGNIEAVGAPYSILRGPSRWSLDSAR